jgi:hypothetical protein
MLEICIMLFVLFHMVVGAIEVFGLGVCQGPYESEMSSQDIFGI